MITGPRILLAALALTIPAPPASADPVFMTGSGTISPGLVTTATGQSVSFTGTATTTTGTYSCAFSGTEFGSVLFSNGQWRGGCDRYSCSEWMVTRAGNVQLMRCTEPQSDVAPSTMVCVWMPSDTNPTTRFTLVCVAA